MDHCSESYMTNPTNPTKKGSSAQTGSYVTFILQKILTVVNYFLQPETVLRTTSLLVYLSLLLIANYYFFFW